MASGLACAGPTAATFGSRITRCADQGHRTVGRSEDCIASRQCRDYPVSRSKRPRHSGKIRYGQLSKTNHPPAPPVAFQFQRKASSNQNGRRIGPSLTGMDSLKKRQPCHSRSQRRQQSGRSRRTRFRRPLLANPAMSQAAGQFGVFGTVLQTAAPKRPTGQKEERARPYK